MPPPPPRAFSFRTHGLDRAARAPSKATPPPAPPWQRSASLGAPRVCTDAPPRPLQSSRPSSPLSPKQVNQAAAPSPEQATTPDARPVRRLHAQRAPTSHASRAGTPAASVASPTSQRSRSPPPPPLPTAAGAAARQSGVASLQAPTLPAVRLPVRSASLSHPSVVRPAISETPSGPKARHRAPAAVRPGACVRSRSLPGIRPATTTDSDRGRTIGWSASLQRGGACSQQRRAANGRLLGARLASPCDRRRARFAPFG